MERTEAKHSRTPVGRAAVFALAAAGGLGLATAPAIAAEWDFTPRVSGGATWTDNVTAADDGLEEDELITWLEPGFNLAAAGRRADLELDYSAQALWYADNSDFDDVYHTLDGRGAFTLVPDNFFLDAFARYDQENIDPGGRITSGNFFRTGNRTDAAVYGLSPWYQAQLGNWGEATARYRYQAVNYTNTDQTSTNLRVQDSDTNSVEAALGSRQGRPGLSWRFSGSYSLTEFETARDFEYARAALDVGYPVGLRTRVTATVGSESDVATDPTKGGLDETFWYVGVAWNPTQLQSLEARVGDRYYGTAAEFRWTRRGTRGDLSLEYTETPTNSNLRLLEGDGVFSGGRPGLPGLDTATYLSKRLSFRATYNLTRTQLAARLYKERRDRQGTDPLARPDDDVMGLVLSADWDAAARTKVNVSARYEDREIQGTNLSSDYTELSAGVRRDIGRNLFGQFRVTHVTRDFASGSGYDINAATLSFGWEF